MKKQSFFPPLKAIFFLPNPRYIWLFLGVILMIGSIPQNGALISLEILQDIPLTAPAVCPSAMSPTIPASLSPYSNITGDGGHAEGGLEERGGLLYTCGASNLLSIYNVSNSSHPILLAHIPSHDMVYDLVFNSAYAYVASHFEGIWVINISDPSSPTILQTFPTSDIMVDLELVNASLYGAGRDKGLFEFSLTSTKMLDHEYCITPNPPAFPLHSDIWGYDALVHHKSLLGAFTSTGFLHLYNVSQRKNSLFCEMDLQKPVNDVASGPHTIEILGDTSIISIRFVFLEALETNSTFDHPAVLTISSFPMDILISPFDPDHNSALDCLGILDSTHIGGLQDYQMYILNKNNQSWKSYTLSGMDQVQLGFFAVECSSKPSNILFLANYEGIIFILPNIGMNTSISSDLEEIPSSDESENRDTPLPPSQPQIGPSSQDPLEIRDFSEESRSCSDFSPLFWVATAVGGIVFLSGNALGIAKYHNSRKLQRDLLVPQHSSPKDMVAAQIMIKKAKIRANLPEDFSEIIKGFQYQTNQYLDIIEHLGDGGD
ncbi:hypothetical protein [Candidatus Lokiarchaeum ossiferum]|uniref:hypothetical protein n=1 Tax=Candidatus Lokiarchaeum ossiferum TaxID=2951803 RepID=UPI00352C3A48